MENDIFKNSPDLKPLYDERINGLDQLLLENGYQRNGRNYAVVRENRDTLVLFCHFGVMCVLLSHLGIWHDTELVEKVQGIDLILGGHSHTEMSEPQIVNGTVIFHSGLHSKMLGRVEIILDEADGTEKSGRRSVTINAENITGACEPFPELEAVLAEETAS